MIRLPRWSWICVAGAVAALTTFWLAWQLPLTKPVVGPSYAFGFNNRVAVLGLMTAVGVGAMIRFLSGASTDSLAWIRDEAVLLPPLQAAGSCYVVAAAFALGMGLATRTLFNWLVNPYWGESGFYLSRIDLLDMGFVPYVDFHHNHGPLTLYVPVWLQRLSQGSLGIEDAYAWTVVAGYFLGFAAVFIFFRAISLPHTAKTLALALTCLPWTCMTFGLNYVPLRFFVVPAGLVLLHAAVTTKSRKSLLTATLTAAAASAVALGISPEMGFASLAGIMAYAGIVWLRGEKAGAACLAASTVLTVAGAVALVPEYMAGVLGFIAGGNNFPIYPNLHNLMFMSVCLLVMCPLISSSFTKPLDPRSPLAAALCAAGGLLIAPAFGRADPGHVIVNSVIPMTLMFSASFHAGPKLRWGWMAIYAVIAVAMIHISYWNHYAWLYREAQENATFVRANPGVLQVWQQQWANTCERLQGDWRPTWRKPVPCPTAILHIVESKTCSLPVASTQLIGLERLVKLQMGFKPLYHPIPVPEIFSPMQSERTAREALEKELVILPAYAETVADQPVDLAAYAQATGDWLSGLLLFPVRPTGIHEPFIAEKDIFQRILAQGEVVDKLSGLLLVKPATKRRQ